MADKPTERSYLLETNASSAQLQARQKLKSALQASPLSGEDLMFNLGLYTRSSVLAKYLVLHELYKRIKQLPGMLCEFGVWYGQNLVLLENLRAIHEPFNKQRKIVGFDTFTGYTRLQQQDRDSKAWEDGSYAVGEQYQQYLASLLSTHEECNVLGNVSCRHELIKGDVSRTARQYFSENAHALIAFAYFDLGLYEPTREALMAIYPHLVPGAILLMDELTWPEAPGEAIAFKEVFRDRNYTIEKCELYPSKSIVIVH